MEDKKYVAKDVEFSLRVKLHDYFTALFRRKDTLKMFCKDIKIDYPVAPDFDVNSKAFPEEYLVRSDEIEYLAKNRDKIILAMYEGYKQCQEGTIGHIISGRNDLEKEELFLAQEKEMNDSIVKRLKASTDPQDKLDFEAKLAESNARVKNTKIKISIIESSLETSELALAENHKSWDNQVSLIDACFDTQAKKYVQSVTKKIRKKLNFTKFTHQIPDYSKNVKEIIEGKINE